MRPSSSISLHFIGSPLSFDTMFDLRDDFGPLMALSRRHWWCHAAWRL
jgi:hypothetical protein